MSNPLTAAGGRATPVKMIVVALMFPIFMALALPGVYLAALHSPVPTHMHVQIIGAGPAVVGLQHALESEAGEALDVSVVASAKAATADLRTLDTRAAYNPSTGGLYVASAGSIIATQAATAVFTQVIDKTGKEGATLTVHDVAPLPASDSAGISLMFIGLAAILAGFVTATVLGVAVPGLRRRTEAAILTGVALAAGTIGTFIGYVAYGALSTNIIGAGLMIAAGTMVAGLVQSGGLKLIGPAMTIIGVSLFVILGIPASGAAVPIDMVPPFFQFLHIGLPTTGVLEGLRRIIYFDSAGLSRNISTLVIWALIGLAMAWIASLKNPKTQPEFDSTTPAGDATPAEVLV